MRRTPLVRSSRQNIAPNTPQYETLTTAGDTSSLGAVPRHQVHMYRYRPTDRSQLSIGSMDMIRPDEIEAIRSEAAGENRPVLMMNCNRYVSGQFPNGELYVRWRTVNQQMLDTVDGKILWTLPVQGQPLVNGELEPLDEILAYWYPSHQAFLDMATSDLKDENMEARKELVEYAVIHRVFGDNPPLL